MMRAGMFVLSAAATLAIAALSRAPYTAPGADDARLRFSWRMSISARENCRPRTEVELNALPVHMRTPEICTPDEALYALVTRIDDAIADTLALARGGVKGDRPLFVLQERTLPAGQHRVRIMLMRTTRAATEMLAELDSVLTLEPRMVQLVTLDAEARQLTVRSSTRGD